MEISVKKFTGKKITFEVESPNIIDHVKAKVIIYSSKHQRDGPTLAESVIQESTLDLILRQREGMKIFLSFPTHKRITLEVNSCDTIGNVKAMIKEKEGIHLEDHSLTFEGKQLDDCKTLADYNIQMESTLDIVFRQWSGTLFLKTSAGKKIILESINSSDTIKSVKAKIKKKEGILLVHQCLFFAEKQLEDDRTLDDYKIPKYFSLDLILRERGGMQVYVRTLARKTITLEVDSSDTIQTMKAMIQESEGIPPEDQDLLIHGKLLKEGLTIGDYNIGEHYIIMLVNIQVMKMYVIVKVLPSHTTSILEIEGCTTVSDLKAKIQDKERVPPSSFVLSFAQMKLEDSCKLSQYNIQKNSIIYLTPQQVFLGPKGGVVKGGL